MPFVKKSVKQCWLENQTAQKRILANCVL